MRIAGHTRGIRRPIVALAFVAGLLGWTVIGWGPWSLLTSLLEGREQPIIWGSVLSMPIPVVATTIIVSLRLWKAGQEADRGQRMGAQPRALAPEGPTAARLALAQQIEEQRLQEQWRAQEQQAQKQQIEARWIQEQPGAQPAQEQQTWAQQTQEQPAAQQTQEQPMAPMPQQADQMKPVEDWLAQMQDRLMQMQEQVPEMQQPVAQLLAQLRQVQEKMPQMTLSEIQDQMRQVHMQLGATYSGLPEGIPPQAQAELARMQQQMAQMMAQVMAQTMAQMQQPAVQQPAVQQPAVQQDQEEINLHDLDLTSEDLASLFEVEEVENPYVAAISEGLEDIDMFDLLEECKEAADQLRRGNSLALERIRERG